MTTIDPLTNQPLHPDAIQRILFIHPSVHVYGVPPLQSTRGHSASQWTTQPEIFQARVRILETAVPVKNAPEKVSVAILLEDPKTGELFAGAPYTALPVVEQTIDSSRFYAIRVVGDGGRKATLGIGFEERPDAFDFGVALQESAKVLGFGTSDAKEKKVEEKHDYSLKEGETITVNIGSKGRRLRTTKDVVDGDSAGIGITGVGDGGIPILSAPPSAKDVRKQMEEERREKVKEEGFDDDFGDFQ